MPKAGMCLTSRRKTELPSTACLRSLGSTFESTFSFKSAWNSASTCRARTDSEAAPATQTLHLHSIEPSSLRNSLKWPLRSSHHRPPSGLRDLLSPSIPQSSVSTFDHSPVPYTLHTFLNDPASRNIYPSNTFIQQLLTYVFYPKRTQYLKNSQSHLHCPSEIFCFVI